MTMGSEINPKCFDLFKKQSGDSFLKRKLHVQGTETAKANELEQLQYLKPRSCPK